jgi:hypothetical protein
VEPIDTAQARDHLEMVDRILAQSEQRLCYGAEYFIVWGIYGAAATLDWQLIDNRILPFGAVWAQAAMLALAAIVTILRARATKASRSRQSLVQREFFNVMWLTLGLAFIANVAAFNVFSGWAQAAIWSYAQAIVLLFIGMHGSRRGIYAGIAVIVSIAVANFAGDRAAGYVLAAGMLAGYCGFGVAELLSHD